MNNLSKVSFVALLLTSLLFVGCTAGPNLVANAADPGVELAGFLLGFWHGFISVVALVISLFNPNVGIYEVHNNGVWYNFGFLSGAMVFFGTGGAGVSKN